MAIGNGLKGFVLGVAGLAALDLLLSSKEGTKTYTTVAQAPSQWLAAWLDPARPLIPDTRKSSGGSSTPGGSDPCAGLFGPAKILCQQQQGASYTTPSYPDLSQLPTTSTATVGGNSPYQLT